MDIKKLLQRPYLSIGKRLFGVGRDDDYFGIMSKWGSPFQKNNQLDYYRGFVYTCINLIGDYSGQYTPELADTKGEEVSDHPFLQLLANPQPDEPSGISQFDLFEATQSFIELTGEAFWYISPGKLTGQPRGIYLLRPDRMGIDIDDNGNIQGYYMRRSKGVPIPFEVKEILHFKNFNPFNPYRGYGTLQAMIDQVQTDEYTAAFTKNFFKNNAGVSGVLSIKGEVSTNAFAKFVRQFREKYEGVDNAGKTAIVRETDADFTKIGLGLDELDMKALREMSKEDIAQGFRIPMALLGKSDNQGLGRAAVETFEYIFTKQTIEPKFKRIDSVLQRAFQRYYPSDKLVVSHENLIPADKEFELNVRDKAVDRWVTRDEIREDDGLTTVPGGDLLRAPINSVPIAGDAPQNGNGNGTGKSIKVKVRKKAAEPNAEELAQAELRRKENFRVSLMHNQETYEKKYLAQLKAIFEEQREEVLEKINPAGAKAKGLKSFLFALEEAIKRFGEKLSPVLEELYAAAGELALRFAGDEDSEYVLGAAERAFIQNNLQRMASTVNQETIDALSKTLAEGMQNGESLSKLAKRVNGVYEQAKGYRAERIARTETLKGSNQATLFAYKQAGFVTAMKWYAQPGHCPICDSVDGKTVNLNESFFEVGQAVDYEQDGETKQYEVSYETVQTPPLHPNCRCTIVPVRG